jgi:hypothetical protein
LGQGGGLLESATPLLHDFLLISMVDVGRLARFGLFCPNLSESGSDASSQAISVNCFQREASRGI